jgi:hypothetical protein
VIGLHADEYWRGATNGRSTMVPPGSSSELEGTLSSSQGLVAAAGEKAISSL